MKISVSPNGQVFVRGMSHDVLKREMAVVSLGGRPNRVIAAYLKLVDWLKRVEKQNDFPKSRYYDDTIKSMVLSAREKNLRRRNHKCEQNQYATTTERAEYMIKKYIAREFAYGNMHLEHDLTLSCSVGLMKYRFKFTIWRSGSASAECYNKIKYELVIDIYFHIHVPYGWLAECINNNGPKVEKSLIGHGLWRKSIHIGDGKWFSIYGDISYEVEEKGIENENKD